MEFKKQHNQGEFNEQFLLACENGDIALAESYRVKGAYTDTVNSVGESALHLAVKSGSRAIVHYLLHDLHLNPNVQDTFGRTPLHWAAQQGNIPAVEELLLAHADVDTKDEGGLEPRIYAETNGHRDLVKVFTMVRSLRK